ncbi:MAG: ABC transporter permease [Phycisphaeraceae bacterium]|nr:MAG: ABC transporter permease [Phycisphaeraceae bacterium]
MIQTWALLVDAYRELNSKKLFWITMALSLLVVCAFGAFGLYPGGYSALWFKFDHAFFNSRIIPPEKFYKFIFASIGIPVWLTWIASILALISTAGIIPDFVSGGAIELSLSKPIGRVRLFLTKYFTGLLFVGFQVGVFTLACIAVIGVRGKSWEPDLLLAIPIVLCFYSYLFAMCALIGLLTRSSIAALLLTLLFWIFLFAMNATDSIFVMQRETARAKIEHYERRQAPLLRVAEGQLKALKEMGSSLTDEDGNFPEGLTTELEVANPMLASNRRNLEEARQSLDKWTQWSKIATGVKTVLPKTQETIKLLERSLLSSDDMKLLSRQEEYERTGRVSENTSADSDDPYVHHQVAARRTEEAFRDRSVWWILGTSLSFEIVVLGIACVIFTRRDF